jgi:hypothetical protein
MPRNMTTGARRSAFLAVLVVVLILGTSSITRATEKEGVSGPIAWRLTDFSLRTTSDGGKKQAVYTIILSLRSTATGLLTLTSYEARASFAGLAELEWSEAVRWSLQHASELNVSFEFSLQCIEGSSPCRAPMGPTLTALLLGSDQKGRPIREVIALQLPPAPGKAITPPTKISRATGFSGSPIPIRIRNNLIVVPAVVNGSVVSLLLDTGAQVTVLSPDVANRLGIVVPPDAPTLPVAGIGARDAPIVILPAFQVGDYVIENLPVAIVTLQLLAMLQLPTDGLLGANFMEFFRMTVDRQAKELRLEPSR